MQCSPLQFTHLSFVSGGDLFFPPKIKGPGEKEPVELGAREARGPGRLRVWGARGDMGL